MQTPQSADTIGYGQRASGTHPTEMHSCTHHNLSLLENVDLFRTVRRGVFGMVKMAPLHNFWSVHYVDKIENETDKLLTCRQSKMNTIGSSLILFALVPTGQEQSLTSEIYKKTM